MGCLVASQAHAAEPVTEVEATRWLCAAGPSAALARATRLRGNAEVAAAGVLPNPALVAEHQRSLSGPTEQETVLGLSVPLGIGGRRFLLQDAAAVRSDQARAEAEATLFESALAFREAYLRAATEQARVGLLAEQQAALDELSTTIQGLTRGGEAAGYDLLRQQAQARLHRSVLEVAKARARASRAILEAWTEHEVALPSAEPLSLATGEPVPSALDGASRTPPRVQGLEAAARASALEARAARRRWVPELDVFAGYRQVTAGAETGHGISLGLTIPLTFFDYGQGEAARAEAEREIATASATMLRLEQRAELRAARLRLDGLAAALVEAETASAQAVELGRKARQLYAAGEATITELLETFRGAEEARMTRLELIDEIARTRLALMRAAGSMFDPPLARACRETRGGRP